MTHKALRSRPVTSAKTLASGPKRDAVRHQLDRLLASVTFQQVDRLKRFISFIVSECPAGRRDELKEYVIGVQVFDKESSFDPRTDPIVRVQARRLRARLTATTAKKERRRDHRAAEGWLRADLQERGKRPPPAAPRSVRPSPARTRSRCNHSPTRARRTISPISVKARQEIIHRLATLEALRVLAVRPATISGDLADRATPGQAAMVLTGGVRKSGDRLPRHGAPRRHRDRVVPWSDSVDAALADPFAAQELVAEAVVKKLEPRLLDAGQRSRQALPRTSRRATCTCRAAIT